MSLTTAARPLSTRLPQIWPVTVIVVVVVLRAPTDTLPAALSAVAGLVALMLGEQLPASRAAAGPRTAE